MSNIAAASSERREEILSERLSGDDRGEEDEDGDGENGDRVNVCEFHLRVGLVAKSANWESSFLCKKNLFRMDKMNRYSFSKQLLKRIGS